MCVCVRAFKEQIFFQLILISVLKPPMNFPLNNAKHILAVCMKIVFKLIQFSLLSLTRSLTHAPSLSSTHDIL